MTDHSVEQKNARSRVQEKKSRGVAEVLRVARLKPIDAFNSTSERQPVACWARPWQCETKVGRGRASSMWIVDTPIEVLRTHISAIDLLSLARLLRPSYPTTQRAVAVRPIVSLLTNPSFNRPPAPENPPYTRPLGHQPKVQERAGIS